MEVVKRDKSIEEFNEEKIKSAVKRVSRDAKLDDETLEKIQKTCISAVQSLKERPSVTTKEIRTFVMNALSEISPEIVNTWEKYDQENKEIGESEL